MRLVALRRGMNPSRQLQNVGDDEKIVLHVITVFHNQISVESIIDIIIIVIIIEDIRPEGDLFFERHG